jgi:urease accessory protein
MPTPELRIEARYQGDTAPLWTLTLPFDIRQKSRLRVALDSGQEVAIQLERGTQLQHGDLLLTTCGKVVQVKGAPEDLSCVQSADVLTLTRAAYHLGNRHVALQIESGRLLYQHDHVLDAMLVQLGLDVTRVQRPFEPESGAYGTGHAHAVSGHSHGHGGHASLAQARSHGRVHADSPIAAAVRGSAAGTQPEPATPALRPKP